MLNCPSLWSFPISFTLSSFRLHPAEIHEGSSPVPMQGDHCGYANHNHLDFLQKWVVSFREGSLEHAATENSKLMRKRFHRAWSLSCPAALLIIYTRAKRGQNPPNLRQTNKAKHPPNDVRSSLPAVTAFYTHFVQVCMNAEVGRQYREQSS